MHTRHLLIAHEEVSRFSRTVSAACEEENCDRVLRREGERERERERKGEEERDVVLVELFVSFVHLLGYIIISRL